jgi:DNA-binding Xre family transcriptional regulator
MTNRPSITSHVRALMQARHISIRRLADLSRLDTTTIQRARDHRIETLSLRTLARIGQALHVDPKDLFDTDVIP